MRRNSKQEHQFAICITDAEPDLMPRKIYQVLPDESAAKSKYIRVIDESGESYLYPASYFVFVELPHSAQRAILLA